MITPNQLMAFLSATRQRTYWGLQVAGWAGFALFTFLSLTLWNNPGQLEATTHTALQSLLGLIVSHGLHQVVRRAWALSLPMQTALNTGAVVIAALIWTMLRIVTFSWLTGETVFVSDYGGWAFASGIVFASWVFCYYAARYYRQALVTREKVAEAERMALRAEARAHEESVKRLTAESLYQETRLRMLHYQINPHFLFNALNSVSHLVRAGEKEKATTMISRIASFMRETLETGAEMEHNLRDEVALLNLYLDIEKVRFAERLVTEFEIAEDALDASVPSFILQPLFENAMKYAVGRTLAPVTLRLDAEIRGGSLCMTVSDTGPTTDLPDRSASATSTGIGLRNVEQRLKSVFHDDVSMDLRINQPQGLRVDIVVPAIRVQGARDTLDA